MESTFDQQQFEKRQRELVAAEAAQEDEVFLVPGVPIVRDNTPRPLSFEHIVFQSGGGQQKQWEQQEQEGKQARHQSITFGEFPVEAPSAPPLPEECEDEEGAESGKDSSPAVEATPLPFPEVEPSHEFVWLFEYGLEMDTSVLNSTCYLNGLALLYGPAVLKGYRQAFYRLEAFPGQVVTTIVPSSTPEVEVWGVLYRVPRQLTEQLAVDEPMALDTLHLATPPNALCERCAVLVHDPYRKREVDCITYRIAASAQQQFQLLAIDASEPAYSQRLQQIANGYRLPQDYRKSFGVPRATNISMPPPMEIQKTKLPPPVAEQVPSSDVTNAASVPPPAPLVEKREEQQEPVVQVQVQRGLVLFATYVGLVFLAVLLLGIVQGLGFGNDIFTLRFAPLGVPWFVLVYGLLGGCVSCSVRLACQQQPIEAPPTFILITWFTRPYFGVVLAMLMYLLLNTGLFVMRGSNGGHALLFSLLGFVAGSCGGWLFYKILPLSFLKNA